jgi:hypothetical protein
MSHSRVLRNAAGTNANDFSDSHGDGCQDLWSLGTAHVHDYSAGTLVFLLEYITSYGSPIDIAAPFFATPF